MTGTVQSGSGATTAVTITVSSTNMSSYAIYGSNPAANCTTGGTCSAAINASGVVAKAVADYFAGLNFGFIGSTEANPNMPGKTIGNSPSYTWYGNPPVPNLRSPRPRKAADAERRLRRRAGAAVSGRTRLQYVRRLSERRKRRGHRRLRLSVHRPDFAVRWRLWTTTRCSR